jgi:hypothetical protein
LATWAIISFSTPRRTTSSLISISLRTHKPSILFSSKVSLNKLRINQSIGGSSEWRKLLGRSRRKCEDSIKVDVKMWIQQAQDRDRWRDLVNTVMNVREKFLSHLGNYQLLKNTPLNGVCYQTFL